MIRFEGPKLDSTLVPVAIAEITFQPRLHMERKQSDLTRTPLRAVYGQQQIVRTPVKPTTPQPEAPQAVVANR